MTDDHYLGVYLTDLTFIEDGIPSLTPSELINFNKRAKTAEVIRDIQQYQSIPYLLQPVPELQDYILSNLQAAGDVHDMYDRSLELEPREREDEKIARYATGGREMGSLIISSIAMQRWFSDLVSLLLLFILFFFSFSPECFKLLSGRYTHTSTQTLLFFFSMIHDWREIVED